MTKRDQRRGIVRTDEELDKLAAVGPEDIEAAQGWWEEHAPARFRALLEAEEEDGPATA